MARTPVPIGVDDRIARQRVERRRIERRRRPRRASGRGRRAAGRARRTRGRAAPAPPAPSPRRRARRCMSPGRMPVVLPSGTRLQIALAEADDLEHQPLAARPACSSQSSPTCARGPFDSTSRPTVRTTRPDHRHRVGAARGLDVAGQREWLSAQLEAAPSVRSVARGLRPSAHRARVRRRAAPGSARRTGARWSRRRCRSRIRPGSRRARSTGSGTTVTATLPQRSPSCATMV